MNDTILDYLEKFGDKSFERLPFGEVDALILSQFSYLKFDGIVPGPDDVTTYVTLQYIKEHKDFDKLFADKRYEKPNRQLFKLMMAGKRFSDLKLDYYINIVDKEKNIQFSAVTFRLPGGIDFVAFRGTDETMIGWKEDFYLSILDRIPGEKEAVKYLKEVAKELPGRFYVGGHSKGGLLSIYSSSVVPESIKKRIISIYSFDGPAIREDIRQKTGYAGLRDKILKYVPQSSLIGMLFETDDIYTVVKSTGVGIIQHDPYTWVVADIDFERLPELKTTACIVNSALEEWLSQIGTADRERFVDLIFGVADACDINDLVTMGSSPVKSIRQLADEFDELDENEKGFLKNIMNALIRETGERTKSEVQSGWNEFVESVDKWIDMVQAKMEAKQSEKKIGSKSKKTSGSKPGAKSEIQSEGV